MSEANQNDHNIDQIKEVIKEIRPDLSRGEIDEFVNSRNRQLGSIEQAIIGWSPSANEKWHTHKSRRRSLGVQHKKTKEESSENTVERSSWPPEYRQRLSNSRGGVRGRGRGKVLVGRGRVRGPGPNRQMPQHRMRREAQKAPQAVTIPTSQGMAWGTKKPQNRAEAVVAAQAVVPDGQKEQRIAKENIAPGMGGSPSLGPEDPHFSKQALGSNIVDSPVATASPQINGGQQPRLIISEPAQQPQPTPVGAVQAAAVMEVANAHTPQSQPTDAPPGVPPPVASSSPPVAPVQPEKKPVQQSRNALGGFKINSDSPPDGMGDFALNNFGVRKLAPPPGITTRPAPKREIKKVFRVQAKPPMPQQPEVRTEPAPQAAKFAISFPSNFVASEQGIEELTKSFRMVTTQPRALPSNSPSPSPVHLPRDSQPAEPPQQYHSVETHPEPSQPKLTLTRPETTTFPSRRLPQAPAPQHHHHAPGPHPGLLRPHPGLVEQDPIPRNSLHRDTLEPPSFQPTNSGGPGDRSNFGISPQFNGGYPNVNNYVPPQNSRLDPNAVPYTNPEPNPYPVPFYYRGTDLDGRMLHDNFFDPTMGPTAPGGGGAAASGFAPPPLPNAHHAPEMNASGAYGQNALMHPQSHMFPFATDAAFRNPHQYMRPYR